MTHSSDGTGGCAILLFAAGHAVGGGDPALHFYRSRPNCTLIDFGGTAVALIVNFFSLRIKGQLDDLSTVEIINTHIRITYVLSVGYMGRFRVFLMPLRGHLAFKLPVHM